MLCFSAFAEKQPNILLITVDDMNYDTPGCFGGPADLTPNIDRLAGEGMRFGRAHVALAICQASRQSLMTGRYPHNAGFRWFEPVADEVPVLTEILRQNGYMNACFGKAEHLQPRARYQWDESLDLVQMKGGRDPDAYHALCRDFMDRAVAAGRPFFLMANAHDPHRPFHGADEEMRRTMETLGGRFAEPSRTYDEGEAPETGFLPDIPEVRRQVAQYMSSCRRADDTVGAILEALEQSGQRDNTLVVFLSDNGMPFPFAKACVYVNSTRTPFIVRWPGRVEAGSANDRDYINGIDFMPTVLEILGLPVPDGTDGRSFLPLLKGEVQEGRDSTVTVFYNAYPVAGGHRPEQTVWYQMRCLHRGEMGYIYNGWSDGTLRFTPKGIPEILREMEATGHQARLDMFRYRTPEELYHFGRDPDGLQNLAESPEFASEMRAMRSQLLAWMEAVGDTDLLPEFRAVARDGGVTEQTPRGAGYLKPEGGGRRDAARPAGGRVRNGDFSSGLDGWAVYRQESGLVAAPEGGTARLANPAGSKSEFARLQQKGIRLEPGSIFELSARVKGETLAGGNGAYLSIGFFAAGQPVGFFNSGIQNSAGTFGWRTVRIRNTVPEGAESATAMLMLNGTGTAWFDDVQLSIGN